MSKLKYLVLSLTILGFVTSCSNASQKEEAKNEVVDEHAGHEHQTAKSTEEEHHKADSEEKLHLNNGKKWIVNEATEVGMKNMQAIIIAFAQNKSTDFAKLGQELGQESQTLINKCDMTGPAHDQLHLVLHPMLTAISGIKKGNAKDVIKMSNLLADYFEHFETAK